MSRVESARWGAQRGPPAQTPSGRERGYVARRETPADIKDHHNRQHDRDKKQHVLGADRAELNGRDVGFVLVIVRVGATVMGMGCVRPTAVAVVVDMHVQAAELRPEQAQANQKNQWQCRAAHGESIHIAGA